ncbi:MAG: cupredoxin domain-containing protein [Nitrospiraceae bacterium]
MFARLLLPLVLLLGNSILLAACEPREQFLRLAAQDYRSVPTDIRVLADRPIRLLIVNEGRERHEFTSSLLANAEVQMLADPPLTLTRNTGTVSIDPGRSVEIRVQAPAGTYLFHCRVRGHAGMRGTMIVQPRVVEAT